MKITYHKCWDVVYGKKINSSPEFKLLLIYSLEFFMKSGVQLYVLITV